MIPDPSLPPGSAFRSAETLKQGVDILATRMRPRLQSKGLIGGDVSFARRNGSHCAACHGVKRTRISPRARTTGTQLIGDFRLAMRPVPSHSVLVGFEARKVDDGDHHEEMGVPPGSSSPFMTAYTKPAFYAQDQVSLATTACSWSADFATMDRPTSSTGSSRRVSPPSTVPRTRSFCAADGARRSGSRTSASYAKNTWFINVDAGFAVIPLAAFGPNPDLKAEEIQTFELGGEYPVQRQPLGEGRLLPIAGEALRDPNARARASAGVARVS